MRRFRIGLIATLAGAWLLSATDPAWAIFGRWRGQPQQPTSRYAPALHRYLVVAPRPYAPGRHVVQSHDDGAADWRVDHKSAPAYPWGWFGAHPRTDQSTHTSYYGDYKDHATRRQP